MSTDFAYDCGRDAAGLPCRIAVLADDAARRSEMLGDLAGAGFRTIDGGALDALLDGPIVLLGDVVLIDCPAPGARQLAALARLDMRAAQSGARLVVATSLEALDDVFGTLDQCDPQILVAPGRADRVVAVGQVMADIADPRVREMTEADRLSLLRLSQQVEAIASKLEGLSGGAAHDRPDGDTATGEGARPVSDAAARQPSSPARLYDSQKPPLPDPRMIRKIIAGRQARARFFDGALFADPAWDMLLDLTAAHGEGQRVSVTSLCIAAEVPATTALRWLKQMVDTGIFKRIADETDRRRAFIALTDRSIEAMSRYFAEVDVPLARAA
ncbi:MarR family transcriptional regulator [Erythrobacter sp. HL-111]|uniref:MarR family transcriptional regulator n=1 Tax=Erythrobacter sp. HL-111 TaxID=1798193 RepID=UPI0006DA4038|nr:MarR family transcriptional regulator [Erythrobacter sp. HL-111]KPP86647.1 MAG: transcriptional regulator [Erythrobacteraceae bacterium HL-111]SDR67875.1 DNA-binding transcriptional regulator, MarR family [Erythrobacter sp. HL-111]